jgi:hypothetical protein
MTEQLIITKAEGKDFEDLLDHEEVRTKKGRGECRALLTEVLSKGKIVAISNGSRIMSYKADADIKADAMVKERVEEFQNLFMRPSEYV